MKMRLNDLTLVVFSLIVFEGYFSRETDAQTGPPYDNLTVSVGLEIYTDETNPRMVLSEGNIEYKGTAERKKFTQSPFNYAWTYCVAHFEFNNSITILKDSNIKVTGNCSLLLESRSGNITIRATLNMTCQQTLPDYCPHSEMWCLGGLGPLVLSNDLCGPGCGIKSGMESKLCGSGHGGKGGYSDSEDYGHFYKHPDDLLGGTSGSCQFAPNSELLGPGYGGGAIELKAEAGQILIDSTINANGQPGNSTLEHGGSSGGTIKIHGRQVILDINSALYAEGTDGYCAVMSNQRGGGSGGFVHIIAEKGIIKSGGTIHLKPGSNQGSDSSLPDNLPESGYLLIDGTGVDGLNESFPATGKSFSWPYTSSSSSVLSLVATPSVQGVTLSTAMNSNSRTVTLTAEETSVIVTTSSIISASTVTIDSSSGSLQDILTKLEDHPGPWNVSVILDMLESVRRITSPSLTEEQLADLLLVLKNINQVLRNNTEYWNVEDSKNIYENVINVVDIILAETYHDLWEKSQKLPELLLVIEEYSETIVHLNTSYSIRTTNIEMEMVSTSVDGFKGIKLPQRKHEENDSWISFQENAFGKSTGNVSIVVFVYKKVPVNIKDSIPAKMQTDGKLSLNSHIVSCVASVEGKSVQLLNKSITMRVQHIQEGSSPKCVYWDVGTKSQGSWADEGMNAKDEITDSTLCTSDHLTSFAVLMKVTDTKISQANEVALTIITYVGCGVSITCLLGTLLIFFSIESIFVIDRYKIHINLIIAILLAQVLFLSGLSATHNKEACKAVAVLLHYFFSAWFSWMCIEGIHLYMKIVTVYHSENIKLRYYYIFGWGLPVLIVTIAAGANFDGYGTKEHCWLSMENGMIWAFVGPVLAVILVNVVVLIVVVKIIVTSASATKTTEYEHVRAGVKGIFVLLPLLGVTWIFGLMIVNSDTVIFEYLFAISNSLQGLFIFIVYCVGNSEVRTAFKRMREKMNLSNGKSDLNHSISDSGFVTKGVSSSKESKPVPLKDRLATKMKKDTKQTKVKQIKLLPEKDQDDDIISTRSRLSNVSTMQVTLELARAKKAKGFDAYKGPNLFNM